MPILCNRPECEALSRQPNRAADCQIFVRHKCRIYPALTSSSLARRYLDMTHSVQALEKIST